MLQRSEFETVFPAVVEARILEVEIEFFFPQTFLLVALNLFAGTKSGRVAVLMNWLKFMHVYLHRYTSHLPVETSRVQFEQITFTHLRGEAL